MAAAIAMRNGLVLKPIVNMMRAWLLLSFAAAWPLPAMAQGQLAEGTVADPRLSAPMPYHVYRPKDAADGEALPALLMLHGHGGSERQWERGGKASQTLERLIEEGVIAPHLLVMPGAGNSWYVQSQTYGAIDQVILDGLMAEIETSYNVGSWAVLGLSMGGYGALRLGFLAPDRFEFIAAFSPAIFAPETEITAVQRKLFNTAFGDPFDPEVFTANSPFSLIPEQLPPIYLSVGDDDYFGLEAGTFAMFQALKQKGHKPELRIKNGGHSWRLWTQDFEDVLREMASQNDS